MRECAVELDKRLRAGSERVLDLSTLPDDYSNEDRYAVCHLAGHLENDH